MANPSTPLPEQGGGVSCNVEECNRPVFKTINNKKLKGPMSFCESHYYAGKLIGAALRKDGQEEYQKLLDKMDEANKKYEEDTHGTTRARGV